MNFSEVMLKKYYLYFHPIMGIRDFKQTVERMLHTFDDFHQYISTKTRNIFGIYFILVKYSETECIQSQCSQTIVIKETGGYTVIVLLCNPDFLDGGDPFMGTNATEKEAVLAILKRTIVR